MRVTFGMVVLYVRDLEKALGFYRRLGLEIPDPRPDRPVAFHRTAGGVTIIFTTDDLARRVDPTWTRPERGYQQVMEFLVEDDAAVDAVWRELTSAGYRGRTPPGHIVGPYATVVDDPDGNVVLISHDPDT
jgi:catechol 2,3-dioxygenase-like lactoylglutathione lyase family enzyme